MIDWLSSWLKQLILIIMLATFVDLLLPNKSMERYVRTVLGLFILMALLTPVIGIFQKESDLMKHLQTADRVAGLQTDHPSDAGMKPLASIMHEAEKIKTLNREQTEQYVEAHMKEQMKQDLQQVSHVEVVRVDANLKPDQNGEPQVNHLRVTLHYIDAIDASRNKTPQRTNRTFQPVEPVHIQIDVGSQTKSQTLSETNLTDDMKHAKQQISQILQEKWQLSSNQLTLQYDNEVDKTR